MVAPAATLQMEMVKLQEKFNILCSVQYQAVAGTGRGSLHTTAHTERKSATLVTGKLHGATKQLAWVYLLAV